MSDRAPEDREEHIRQLLSVNERQAKRIVRLTQENARLRQKVTALKEKAEQEDAA